ncbi:MAG TPA: wax ester/triacylglycerol synthase family O-acyltransferase [Candidatus Binatia bacterium]|nr:wax ester/triacylglycerol synthase family O-acyltransferase [Candidatus Binatia bacterium]
MSYTHHERLSAVDSGFLALETTNSHMHIGAVAEFEAAPLAGPDGRLDFARIEHAIEVGIHRVPRYRQRLEWVPLLGHPVWVDDPSFNLHYHVRHTCLPPPGDERQLKRLTGRIFSQQLDRGKPLWEMWVVEGLASGRIAVITKAHHCMIDGVGSVELTSTTMQPTADPDPRFFEPAPRWIPRPAPSPLELLASELGHRISATAGALGAAARGALRPRRSLSALSETLEGVADAVTTGMRPASPTPLNVDIGPHRRFDWCEMDLARVREIKSALGGTVNDVVLAIVTGALRRFLRQRGLTVEGLDFRAMIPVNLRDQADRTVGNRVAMLVAHLPIDARAPRDRLDRVIAETRALKRSHQSAGMAAIEEIGDATFTSVFVEFARATALTRPFNLVVTNVPGPPFPVYMLGSRMLACHPMVPLFRGQALGIALFSYDGRLYWGFNADWDAIPDLHDLVAAVEAELGHLQDAAGVAHAAPGEMSLASHAPAA